MKKNILIAAFGVFLGSTTFATAQLSEKNNNCCKPKAECCVKGAACCETGEKAEATSSVVSTNASVVSNDSDSCPMSCC